MIKASHNAFFNWFYTWFARLSIRSHFANFHIDIGNLKSDKPLLVLCNHHSWWDGFWVLEFNRRFLDRRYHVMMLEEQLKKHISFKYIGAYSVKKGGRSLLDSLNYTLDILKDPRNMVLIFPQGELQSQHRDSVDFGAGIEYILNHSADIDILMLATFTDYLEEKKSSVYFYGELMSRKSSPIDTYNTFYKNCKMKQSKLCR